MHASGYGEGDDKEAWESWAIKSDSSEDSSDSGSWTNVESDGEDHLSLSNSDSEMRRVKKSL